MSNTERQVALVTGASSGMGKDFVKALLQEGRIVYAAARRVEKMDDLEALGAIPLAMDITQENDIQKGVDTIAKEQGGVDILINNAGFGLYGSVEETAIDDARYQFEVNLFGLARLTQLVIPYMRQHKSGKIINISSVAGKIYTPLGAWYHATKHALEGWSDCLRLELKPFGIDVVVIEPGAIKTAFAGVMTGPMLERSGSGPYADIANKMAKISEHQEGGAASPPSVITDLVMKSIRADKPKNRYAGGKYAFLLLFTRKWLGDRVYDKMIRRMLR